MGIAEILGQLILGWLITDLITGLFHWIYDRIWWPSFAGISNDDHHASPLAFTELSFLGRSKIPMMVGAVVTALLYLLFGFHPYLIPIYLGLSFWNEIHLWAHRPSLAPSIVRPLQEVGILKSPKRHAAHHRPPHSRDFCMLSDWLNPILDALGIWSFLERFKYGRSTSSYQ